jgi:hypothetical protein
LLWLSALLPLLCRFPRRLVAPASTATATSTAAFAAQAVCACGGWLGLRIRGCRRDIGGFFVQIKIARTK